MAGDQLARFSQRTTSARRAGPTGRICRVDGAGSGETRIKLQPEGGRTESYFFSKATILDRVELSTIQFSVGNRGPDWLLIAFRIDPRFNNDPDFPNQWRLIPNDAAAPLGVPHVYDASGFYVKVTKLTAPVGEGAVFIEYHMVFEEPNDWFDGSSELSSKLDFLILAEAKRVRKKLAATPVAQ